MMKRLLDVMLAGSALVVSAPVLAAAAAAIKLESPGPAFYIQTRVGRGRRPIRILKLRTMVADADRVGPGITAARDPRVTRIGSLLRRAKLDELPQLWNVVRGDMSLVGPRPEVPRYVASYQPDWARLFEVKPGLTDRASIAFRDEEGLLAMASDRERAYTEVVMPMKLALALDDIACSSVLHDLRVIARTAVALFRPAAADAAIIAEARRRIAALDGGP